MAAHLTEEIPILETNSPNYLPDNVQLRHLSFQKCRWLPSVRCWMECSSESQGRTVLRVTLFESRINAKCPPTFPGRISR